MANSSKLLIIRYFSILFFIISLYNANDSTAEFLLLIFILLFIINNQCRLFIIKNINYKLISLVLETMLASLICFKFNGDLCFAFIPLVMDSIFLLDIKNSKIILFLCLVLVSSSIVKGFNLNSLYSLFILLMIYFLALAINEESKRKVVAQDLYDKLRISEDKLKEANSNLKLYADSIEELTILKERNRISREIHDSVGHALSTSMIQLNAIEKLAANDEKIATLSSNLRDFINNSLQDVRKAVRDLKPDNYSAVDNILRLQDLAKNFGKLTGIHITFTLSKNKWELTSSHYSTCYRIIQEALSNALRHGKASKINIYLTFSEDQLLLTIKDNGIGANLKLIESGVGLKSISERASELNGSCQYISNTNDGFIIKIILPRKVGGFLNE